MSLQVVRLGVLCEKIMSGGTPSTENETFWDGEIPWITSADIDGRFSVTPKKFITQKPKANILPAGNILVVTRVGLGKVAINAMDLAFSQDIQGLVTNSNVNNQYLIYCLLKKVEKFKSLSRGATIKGVTREDLVNLQIPLPPLPTQKHIASILDKADALRQQNRQLLEHYDALLQSTFIEMFGDPVENPKGWDVRSLVDLCDDVVDCPHSTSNHKSEPTNYPSIRTTELKNGAIEWSSMKYVELEEYKARTKRLVPKPGDIVYGREGSFGEAIIIPEETTMCLGQRVMLFRPNYKICNSTFFWSILRSDYVYNQAVKKTSGSTVGHINVKDVKLFSIILPPLDYQQQFASIADNIQMQRSSAHASLAESEALFQGLLAGYFGEN